MAREQLRQVYSMTAYSCPSSSISFWKAQHAQQGETAPAPQDFSTAPHSQSSQLTVWSMDQQCQHHPVGWGGGGGLIRNAESQAPPWAYGIWICMSIKFPGDSHSQVHNKFEKQWPKLSPSDTQGLYKQDTLFKDRWLPQKGGADPLAPTAKAVPDKQLARK